MTLSGGPSGGPQGAAGALAPPTADLGLAKLRKPTLSQGMLAADILSAMLAAREGGRSESEGRDDGLGDGSGEGGMPRLESWRSRLAQAWLDSQDRWAPALLRLCFDLLSDHTHGNGPGDDGWSVVVGRAVGMLRRLGGVALASPSSASSGAEKRKRRRSKGASSGDVEMLERALGEDGAEEARRGWEDDLDPIVRADFAPSWGAVIGALSTPRIEKGVLKELVGLAALEG